MSVVPFKRSPDGPGVEPPEPPNMDARITKLEVISDTLDKRLSRIEKQMDDGFRDMRADFRWVIGIQIATLLAIISLLAKAANIF